MKAAVIGSGISGLSAAWLLCDTHQVTLFEKESGLGGHAHTALVKTGKGTVPVDTGFMVFNPTRYPNLTAFFKVLKVETVATSMRFSVSMHDGGFEWNSDVPFGIFVDKRNFLRPSFWLFLSGIVRFNSIAKQELKKGIPVDETLEAFLDRHRISEAIRIKYVYPLVGAIWSTPVLNTKTSPALSLLTFLDNHRLLTAGSHPKWQTVVGGSRMYVEKVFEHLTKKGARIKLGVASLRISRTGTNAIVHTPEGDEVFDHVVLATHADTTLSLLSDASDEEKAILSNFTYEENEVVLHGDASYMPHRRRAWAAWNYLEETRGADGLERVSLTYHMNELQHLDPSFPLFVTLNPHAGIAESLVYEKYIYHHPTYTSASIRAQKQLENIQNKNRTLFCGSYFGYGFHEDGIVSAIGAVRYLDVTPPWKDE